MCVQTLFDPVHVKTHIPKIRKGVFHLCAWMRQCVHVCVCGGWGGGWPEGSTEELMSGQVVKASAQGY